MKPFLILQLREMDEAANDEFEAFLNFGNLVHSQVRRIRMERESFAGLDPGEYSGVIVGGGPSNVSDPEDQKPEFQRRFEGELNDLYKRIFENDLPFLGSCYGLGSVINYAGGTISKAQYAEPVGAAQIMLLEPAAEDSLLQGLAHQFTALCGHKEACQTLPDSAVLLASSDVCPVQLVRFRKNIYATQFHCELDALGLVKRIGYYKYHGYFNPESAKDLIASVQNVKVEVPQLILKRFVDRYRSS